MLHSSAIRSAVLMILGALSAPALVVAEDSVKKIDVPPGQLTIALKILAEQSGVEFLYSTDQLEGLKTPGVSGEYTAEQAVHRLLEGTKLKLTRHDSGALVITSAATAAGADANQTRNTLRLAQADVPSPSSGDGRREDGERAAAGRQSAGSAQSEKRIALEEVVVTAQRREESLQDVPVSVSVLSSGELEARGASQLEDVQYSVPGLSTFQYSPGQQFIQLRGVATTIGPATTGQYIDEMPFTSDGAAGAIDIRLIDIDRVEVLRGPQPTLYGESSMGGTIHYVTARPDLDTFSSDFFAEAGAVEDSEQSYRTHGVVNAPLGRGVVGLRLAAGYQRDGGWIDNLATGEDDQNVSEISTLRGTLLVRPTLNTDIALLAIHQEGHQDNQNFGIDRRSNAAAPQIFDDDYDLINGVLTHDFGSIDFTYSLGFIDRSTFNSTDFTPFFLPLLLAPPPAGLGITPGTITAIQYTAATENQIVTHEARIGSDGEGVFDWILGAYARESESELRIRDVTSPGSLGFNLVTSDTESLSRSRAVYGEASWHISSALTLLAGARYYEDHKTSGADDDTFSSVNPRLNVRYEFSPTSMAYVNVGKGFRSGGFLSGSSYDSDELWSYELGTRHQLLNGRVLFDAAVYYNDWRDVQNYFFVGSGPSATLQITNGGDASGYGVDLSLSAKLTERLTFTGTYGWNDIEYTTDSADKDPGDPVDFAVPQSYSASLDYRRPVIGVTEGFFRLDYLHAADGQITLRNFGQIAEAPGRSLVNLRIGLDFGAFDLALFGNNVLDEDAPVIRAPFSVFTENTEQRPRTIGIALGAHF